MNETTQVETQVMSEAEITTRAGLAYLKQCQDKAHLKAEEDRESTTLLGEVLARKGIHVKVTEPEYWVEHVRLTVRHGDWAGDESIAAHITCRTPDCENFLSDWRWINNFADLGAALNEQKECSECRTGKPVQEVTPLEALGLALLDYLAANGYARPDYD